MHKSWQVKTTQILDDRTSPWTEVFKYSLYRHDGTCLIRPMLPLGLGYKHIGDKCRSIKAS